MPELNLPIPGITEGPQWAIQLNQNFQAVDAAVDEITLDVATLEDAVQDAEAAIALKAPLAHSHSASDINSGTLSISRIPTGTTGTTVALGNHTHSATAVGAVPAFADPGGDRIVFWDDSANQFTALSVGANLTITGTTLDATGGGGGTPPPDASETVKGIVELATTAETTAGTDTTRAVTPAGVAAAMVAAGTTPPDASTTVKGLVELATTAETVAGTDPTRAVTPAGLQSVADGKANTAHEHAATDITSGTLALARIPTGTTSTTVALGNHGHALTDANITGVLPIAQVPTGTTGTTVALGNHGHALTDANITGVLPIAQIPTGTTGTTVALGNHTHTAAAVGAIPSFTDPNADRIVFWDDSASAYVALAPSAPLSISGTTLSVGAASETATGVAERATNAETQAMTDTTRYISPANLASAAATTPTANRIARYSASGILQSNEPAASADVATKNYVDTRPAPTLPSALGGPIDFKMDRIAEFVGPTGTQLVIPTHVSPAGGQTTHPSVVYSAERWNGYHYWMGHTPYPGSNDDHEDPNLAVSNDGITWIAAPGVTQPLDDQDGTPEYNSDVELAFGPDNRLYVFWRTYDTGLVGTEERLWVRYSTDGVNFSAKQMVWQSNHTVRRYLSPAFVWEDNRWKMWAVDIIPANHTVIYRQATVGVKVPTPSDWSAETVCTMTGMQSGKEPWHLGVTKIGSTYVMLLNDAVTGSAQVDGDLVLFTSGNGISWAGPSAAAIPRVKSGGHDRIYRATCIPEIRNGVLGLRIWYSAWLIGPPAVWNIFRTWVGLGIGAGIVRHGTESVPTVNANGGGVTMNITFPLPFDREPVVQAYTNSGRCHLALLSKSASGFSVRIENYTTANAAGSFLYWSAFTP